LFDGSLICLSLLAQGVNYLGFRRFDIKEEIMDIEYSNAVQ